MQARLHRKGEQLAIKSAETLTDRVLRAAGLAAGLLGVIGIAQTKYLAGPRPAHIQSVTGRLRSGLQSRVTVTGTQITGQVGDSVKYAAYHEFGFHGTVNVRAHTRINRFFSLATGAMLEVRKQAISRQGVFLGFKESNVRALARIREKRLGNIGFNQSNVAAHQRRIDYAGKPFVRPALEEGLPMIIEEINRKMAAVKE